MPDAPSTPEIRTRKPTGKPPWPMILLAGAEKSGKSYSAAAFSASDLIDRTFWIEIGEGAADQYGALPGTRYEIVEHDGTYRGIGGAIWAATQQPRENGKPHCIVIDSSTELWDLLSDEAQAEANARYRRKNPNKPQDSEAQITMDLWNIAKKRWRAIIDMLRTYDGPVILTSRLEQVAVIENGKPTEAKTLKVRAEKNLPYEVDAIVQIPGPRQYQLTGVRSVRWTMKPGGFMELPDFTVDQLLRDLGLDEVGATSARSYVAPKGHQQPQEMTTQEAVAKMRRDQPQQPADDEWSTAAPDDAAPEASARESTQQQRKALAVLIENKRGVKGSDRGAQRAIAAGMLGRPVSSFTELTTAEASRLIDALDRMPDHAKDSEAPSGGGSAPNPRNGDHPVPDATAAALGLPTLGQILDRQAESPVHEQLLALVADAPTQAHLDRLGDLVKQARVGAHLTEDEFARIAPVALARTERLRKQGDAPAAGQLDAAGRFAGQIAAVATVDAMDALYGTLVEARDGGMVTQEQFDALATAMESRVQALPEPGDGEPSAERPQGWSHRGLARMAGSAQ